MSGTDEKLFKFTFSSCEYILSFKIVVSIREKLTLRFLILKLISKCPIQYSVNLVCWTAQLNPSTRVHKFNYYATAVCIRIPGYCSLVLLYSVQPYIKSANVALLLPFHFPIIAIARPFLVYVACAACRMHDICVW